MPPPAETAAADHFLTVSNGNLLFNGAPAFLSGANLAWINYGNDFGNNQSHGHFCALREVLANTSRAGGHAMRVWLHVEGDNNPLFDDNGFVVGTDAAGTLVEEMRAYLRAAAELDVLVFFCLWNGAVLRNQKTLGLFASAPKLQSYLDKVLSPMVAALAGEAALGGWEVMNEPEGSVAAGVADAEACFDTMALKNTGAGWAQPDHPIPMQQVLRFVGAHAAAIHAADPKALVTVGAWSEHSISDVQVAGRQDLQDYYTPACLAKATGGAAALDFYQVHSYAQKGRDFQESAPFRQDKAAYGLRVPLVVGEFSPGGAAHGQSAAQLYEYAHAHGYGGAWGWTAEADPTLYDGMASLRGAADVAVVQLPHAGLPDTCNCSDVPPDPQYTCAQQESWGKCGESWMAGYCCRSCFACSPKCTGAGRGGGAPAERLLLSPDWAHADYRAHVEAAQAAAIARAA